MRSPAIVQNATIPIAAQMPSVEISTRICPCMTVSAKNSGDNDRESDAPAENKVDAIALDAQQASD